jgi:hypothetical protein
MRINLVTPFAEKDAVKALGARWDGAQKIWYVVDVADLTPFTRWIPDMAVAAKPPAKPSQGVITKSAVVRSRCGCKVLPWEDCEHSA